MKDEPVLQLSPVSGKYTFRLRNHIAWIWRQQRPVNSNTTGTITPMFSSYDWMNAKFEAKGGNRAGKMACSKGLGKVMRSEKFVFERKYA